MQAQPSLCLCGVPENLNLSSLDLESVLRCAGKAGNPFQTTQGNRLSCRDHQPWVVCTSQV